ncbi:hypothetical protein AM1_G0086 (plasmid) [Acaryochloris marina MBIC11017]|uniref:Uncharacterized protein n=1 Tax=Acaryochloris marina (strain MBIC 11017) TaxID=329726 RepID=A8ZQI0_ACAM1|nr:hypothetical protein AM1_G0086 [Acaryochloris marina MBIC11017]
MACNATKLTHYVTPQKTFSPYAVLKKSELALNPKVTGSNITKRKHLQLSISQQ